MYKISITLILFQDKKIQNRMIEKQLQGEKVNLNLVYFSFFLTFPNPSKKTDFHAFIQFT